MMGDENMFQLGGQPPQTPTSTMKANVKKDKDMGIQKIVDCKADENGRIMYHVKWHMTWEPAETLQAVPHLVEEFWRWMNDMKGTKCLFDEVPAQPPSTPQTPQTPQTKKRKIEDVSGGPNGIGMDGVPGLPGMPGIPNMPVMPGMPNMSPQQQQMHQMMMLQKQMGQASPSQQQPMPPFPNPHIPPQMAQSPHGMPGQFPQAFEQGMMPGSVPPGYSPVRGGGRGRGRGRGRGSKNGDKTPTKPPAGVMGDPFMSPGMIKDEPGIKSDPDEMLFDINDPFLTGASPSSGKGRGRGRGRGRGGTTPKKPKEPMNGMDIKMEPGDMMHASPSNGNSQARTPSSSGSATDSIYEQWSNEYAKVSFTCRICNKEQKGSKQSWKTHYESHADVKNFECTICNKAFRFKGDLKRHVGNVHKIDFGENCYKNLESGPLPPPPPVQPNADGFANPYVRATFMCVQCGKELNENSKQSWKTHYESHSGMKPFGCYVCQNFFRFKGDLKRHIHNVHGQEMDESLVVVDQQQLQAMQSVPSEQSVQG